MKEHQINISHQGHLDFKAGLVFLADPRQAELPARTTVENNLKNNQDLREQPRK